MDRATERAHRGVKTAPGLEPQGQSGSVTTGYLRKPAEGISMQAVFMIASAILSVSWPGAKGAETVVYRNDFDAKPGSSFSEWSSSRITYSSKFEPPGSGSVDPPGFTNVESPGGKRRFLGEFGGPRIDPTARTRVRQTIRLKLDKLPRHSEATVSFDLLILRSWDGSSPQYGPDRFTLKAEGGPTLLDTTFSNNPKLDSDKSYQDYPGPGSLPQAGAATVKTLGYGFFGDSTYRLTFTFPHKADSLTLEFASDLFEGKGTGDESWGLDDVTVKVAAGKAPALTAPSVPLGASSVPPVKADKALKVVVFGGHPDDPESGAGGLFATLTRRGHEVICAYVTAYRGDRRFLDRPEAEVRRGEATAACKVLGAKPKFFPYAHETLNADEDTLKAVSEWLDGVKPDVVVTHWPLDTHPNHHAVSSLVWRCYKRRGGWNLYFFEVMTGQQTVAFEPDFYLDIGPVRGVKKRSLDAHKSQGPADIWKAHETMHRRRGVEGGVEFAEAYKLVEAKERCPLLPVKFLGKPAESRRSP